MFKEKLDLLKNWLNSLLVIYKNTPDILSTEVTDPINPFKIQLGDDKLVFNDDKPKEVAAALGTEVHNVIEEYITTCTCLESGIYFSEPIRDDEITPDEVVTFDDLEVGDVFMFNGNAPAFTNPVCKSLMLKTGKMFFKGDLFEDGSTYDVRFGGYVASEQEVIKIGELDD